MQPIDEQLVQMCSSEIEDASIKYANGHATDFREVARIIIAALRAQADAQPVGDDNGAQRHHMRLQGYADDLSDKTFHWRNGWSAGVAYGRCTHPAPETAQARKWNGLTADEKDQFVGSLVEHGTDFVAPLYAVVESIENVLKEKNQAQANPSAAPEAAQALSDREIYAIAKEHGYDIDSGTFYRVVRAILTRASAATVAEQSEQGRMNELTRASAAGQAEGIKLGIAMQKDRQGILVGMSADEAFKKVSRHAGDICEWEEGLMRNAWDAALEFAAQQQAEPVGDEAFTHRMNIARTVYALRTHKDEPQPERRNWFDAGFKAGFADRAAQSGQRAGVDEDARDATRWRAIEPYLGIDDVGDEDFIYGLVVYADRLEEDSNRLTLWKNECEASVGAAIDAIAAAPTPAAQGGDSHD